MEEYDAIKTSEEENVQENEEILEDCPTNLFCEYDDPSDSDATVEEVDEERGSEERFGVNKKCVFNELQPFHCVTSMPPDSMHDLMEGRQYQLIFLLML